MSADFIHISHSHLCSYFPHSYLPVPYLWIFVFLEVLVHRGRFTLPNEFHAFWVKCAGDFYLHSWGVSLNLCKNLTIHASRTFFLEYCSPHMDKRFVGVPHEYLIRAMRRKRKMRRNTRKQWEQRNYQLNVPKISSI